MKNEEMSLRTKRALADALKKLMRKKPLHKISVSDLIKECNINRNTFYYHFQDIHALLNWIMEQEAIKVINKVDLLVNTEEAVRYIFDYIDRNQYMIGCIHTSYGSDAIRNFLHTGFISVIHEAIVIAQRNMKLDLEPGFTDFIAEFYTEALSGLLISWFKNRDKIDREEAIQNILFICHVTVPMVLKEKAAQKNTR